jgi:hypothetical protein
MACTYPTGGRALPCLLPTRLSERNSRTRDTRHFNSLAEAEEFAETMRRMNRIFTNLSGAEKAEVH